MIGKRRRLLPTPDNEEPKRPIFEERLEAISHTLELVVSMQFDNEKRYEKRFADTEKRFTAIAVTLQQIADNQKRDGEHILALVRIAELHDRRLTNLEEDQQT